MSRGLSVMMLAVSLVVAGCGGGYTGSTVEQTQYAETAPPVGKRVDFTFYTHCGVESARIGGVWWVAAQPLYGDEGPGSSPDGWDNPYQAGRLTVRSATEAVFEARGVRVALVPSASGKPMRMCQ
ncbi:MAG TPA: hypothetical protein VLL08_18725 [Kineosporiaceae bacterium]|nr:hypothetical protein [Kineosporiaceae bacterium]